MNQTLTQSAIDHRLLSVRQVAAQLGLSIRAVYRLVARRDFPKPVKLGGATRFYASDLASYLERLRAQRDAKR